MKTLLEVGRTVVEIGVVLSAAGLIVGIVGITGLGSNLVMFLANLGEHGLFILLVASAVVSLVLGMGMPSVAAYTLVAVLVAPAMIELGVYPLAAHLFVFYFAICSNFTPPIALASFAAAPIAKASPNKISFTAMKLGIVAYIVPFMFVYSPGLLLRYEMPTVSEILSIVTAFIAVWLLSACLVGYLFRNLPVVQRTILTISAICLIIPIDGFSFTFYLNIIGAILAVLVLITEWVKRDKRVDNNMKVQESI